MEDHTTAPGHNGTLAHSQNLIPPAPVSFPPAITYQAGLESLAPQAATFHLGPGSFMAYTYLVPSRPCKHGNYTGEGLCPTSHGRGEQRQGGKEVWGCAPWDCCPTYSILSQAVHLQIWPQSAIFKHQTTMSASKGGLWSVSKFEPHIGPEHICTE